MTENRCATCGARLRVCAACGGFWCKWDGNPTGCDACKRPSTPDAMLNILANLNYVPTDDETPEWNKAADWNEKEKQ